MNPTPTNPPAPVPSVTPFELKALAVVHRDEWRKISGESGPVSIVARRHEVRAWACEQMADQLERAIPPKPLPNARDAAVELIAEERARQVAVEGWTPEHDDEHNGAEMATAAACYALPARQRSLEDACIEMDAARGCSDPAIPYTVKTRVPKQWPWDPEWWKPTPKNRIRELVKAGALIAAEIDRLQRSAATARAGGGVVEEKTL